jgi:hypothetical protein
MKRLTFGGDGKDEAPLVPLIIQLLAGRHGICVSKTHPLSAGAIGGEYLLPN